MSEPFWQEGKADEISDPLLLLLQSPSKTLNLLKNRIYFGINTVLRRSAGEAERDGLENRCGGNPTQGSNPCSSANSWLIKCDRVH